MGQSNHPQLTPQSSLHGSPLHQGGPQGGFQRYPAPPPGPRPVQPPLSSSGPEKPQRQYSYELEGPVQVKPEQGRTSQNRVRFQDPQSQESSELSQLRLSAVEQEFRRRVELYTKEYTSDSEDDDAKISTIKRNGNIANNLNQTEKDNDKRALEEREREMKIEE